VIERGHRTDVATALSDRQHLAVGKAIDALRDLLHVIDAELADNAYYAPSGMPGQPPSNDDYLSIKEKRLREIFTGAHDLVAEALTAIQRQERPPKS
jgi:hypothetical protein